MFRFAATALMLAFAATSAAAAEKPYRVSLVGDGFDGKAWHTGVLIELAPGWKTYWRMPGDSGVPPEFTWSPSRPARIDVSYPVPTRYTGAGGETIGYEEQVLFPVTVTPGTPGALDLHLGLFFAVCKDVCVPAQAEASIALGPEERDPLGSARVGNAAAAVPSPGDAVAAAEVVTESGKPALRLSFREKPDDIFVETTGAAYFHAPQFAADGKSALLAIDNAGDAAALKGLALTLTYVSGGKGHQQSLTLP